MHRLDFMEYYVECHSVNWQVLVNKLIPQYQSNEDIPNI